MRSRFLFASLALLLAACGDDDDNGQAQTIETTTTVAEEGSSTTSGASSDLSDVVVQLDDMPAGWSVTPPESDDDTDDELCEGQDPFNEIEPQDEAESGFQQSELGPFVSSAASQYADEDQAGEMMDQLAEATNACQSFTQTDEDGTETEFTISALSFPDLGDETFAFRLAATTMLGPLTMDFAVVREGSTGLLIANGGLGAAPDSELTESLLQTMLDRL
jgi:hypothetical protein